MDAILTQSDGPGKPNIEYEDCDSTKWVPQSITQPFACAFETKTVQDLKDPILAQLQPSHHSCHTRSQSREQASSSPERTPVVIQNLFVNRIPISDIPTVEANADTRTMAQFAPSNPPRGNEERNPLFLKLWQTEFRAKAWVNQSCPEQTVPSS
ncbi:hypothetical protein Tco_0906117 [Tanacetum coccineum]